MKTHRNSFLRWTVNLFLLAFVLVVGLAGFTQYNITQGDHPAYAFLCAVYSTVRLFAASLEVDKNKVIENAGVAVMCLFEAARLAALYLSGNVLFRLLQPITSGVFVKIRTWIWERKKEQVLIIGGCAQNCAIYRSIEDSDGGVLLVPTLEECDALKKQDVKAITRNIVSAGTDTGMLREQTEEWIVGLLEKAVERDSELTVIVNTQDNEVNLHICGTAVKRLRELLGERVKSIGDSSVGDGEKMENRQYIVDMLKRLRIFVFGDREYRSVYLDLVRESFGVIKYINKNQATAFEFVREHPFTEALSREQFDKYVKNACVSPELSFNMILVGFGETNQEVFTVSFANNQYVEKRYGEMPRPKKVNYHIFEKVSGSSQKILNHTVLRYRDDFMPEVQDADTEKYFELPDFPANIEPHRMDVDGPEFYRAIMEICLTGGPSVNYIVISIGSDLKNMDLAQRLAEKKAEWGADNISIFARVRGEAACEIGGAIENHDYTDFGNEEKLVYNYDRIRRDDFEELAKKRNLMYALENDRRNSGSATLNDLRIRSQYEWYVEYDFNKRLSNLYSILSLRMKLQLLGLDCEAQATDTAGETLDSIDSYFNVYAPTDRPARAVPYIEEIGKEIYSYETMPTREDFIKGSTRNNLIVQEHYRWNAFMFSQGFVPQSIEKSLSGQDKDYSIRKHANLSSFEGLSDYKRIMADSTKESEKNYDVVRYDCQIMDDAWWFLHSIDRAVYKRWKTDGAS